MFPCRARLQVRSTLALCLLDRETALGRKLSCLGPQKSAAIADDIV